jgi:pimeloyl-ACP methyl ester carboxylesterase
MEGVQNLRVPFESVPVAIRAVGAQGAPLVLFAHPFPLNGSAWEPQLRAAADAGFRAAAFDAPGFGGSPALGRHLRMEDLAQIMALAMEALSSPRAVLVGSSMGGYAVQAFARQHRDRLAGAVLVGTKAAADTPEAREKREAQALTALGHGAVKVIEQVLPNLVSDGNAAALTKALEIAATATAQGVADALRGMAERPDSRPSLKEWTAPALVIGGEQDKVMTAADIDALAAGIPVAWKRTLPAGHLVMLERPAELSELVVSFLNACRSANAWSRRATERQPVRFP